MPREAAGIMAKFGRGAALTPKATPAPGALSWRTAPSSKAPAGAKPAKALDARKVE